MPFLPFLERDIRENRVDVIPCFLEFEIWLQLVGNSQTGIEYDFQAVHGFVERGVDGG